MFRTILKVFGLLIIILLVLNTIVLVGTILSKYPKLIKYASYQCENTEIKLGLKINRGGDFSFITSNNLYRVESDGQLSQIVSLGTKEKELKFAYNDPNKNLKPSIPPLPLNTEIPIKSFGEYGADTGMVVRLGDKRLHEDRNIKSDYNRFRGSSNREDGMDSIFSLEEFDSITDCVMKNRERINSDILSNTNDLLKEYIKNEQSRRFYLKIPETIPENIHWWYATREDELELHEKAFGSSYWATNFANSDYSITLSSSGVISITEIETGIESHRMLPGMNFFTLNPHQETDPLTDLLGPEIWTAINRDGVTFKDFLSQSQEKAGITFDETD